MVGLTADHYFIPNILLKIRILFLPICNGGNDTKGNDLIAHLAEMLVRSLEVCHLFCAALGVGEMNTGSIDTKTIAISRISVTAGTRMRRYVPASRGRALPYEKISSNIFVEVVGEEKAKKAAPKAEDKKENK